MTIVTFIASFFMRGIKNKNYERLNVYHKRRFLFWRMSLLLYNFKRPIKNIAETQWIIYPKNITRWWRQNWHLHRCPNSSQTHVDPKAELLKELVIQMFMEFLRSFVYAWRHGVRLSKVWFCTVSETMRTRKSWAERKF